MSVEPQARDYWDAREEGGWRDAMPSELPPQVLRYLPWKYAFEYILACIAVVGLTPLLAIVALLIKLDSNGPVLFRQTRIGRNLKPFTIFKFRTMVQDAHQQQGRLQALNEMSGGGLFKSERDPRITRMGRLLRKFSIDELPQLFNIVRGDMTIVGPRPLSTAPSMYRPDQLGRFHVKPGLACLWQAYHRRETDFERWIQSDLDYVATISPGLDLKLMLVVARNALLGRGAR